MYDELALNVAGVLAVDSNKPTCILVQDLLSFTWNTIIRRMDACTKADGSTRIKLEAGEHDSGVWFNVRLYGTDDKLHMTGKNTDVMCMSVLTESLGDGQPFCDVFFHKERADRVECWLLNYKLDPTAVVRTFLDA